MEGSMKKIMLVLMLALFSVTAYAADDGESRMVTTLGRAHAYSEADVFKVWCVKKAPTCTYGDRQVTRSELALIMPRAKWGYCRKEFCYGDSHMSDVIGLNPEYFMYPVKRRNPNEVMATQNTP
jgi:hypothetical protein